MTKTTKPWLEAPSHLQYATPLPGAMVEMMSAEESIRGVGCFKDGCECNNRRDEENVSGN